MSHWLLEKISQKRKQALLEAGRVKIFGAFLEAPPNVDFELVQHSAGALELVILDLLNENKFGDDENREDIISASADAFRLLCVLPRPIDALEQGKFLLKMAAFSILGDKGADAARILKESPWKDLPMGSEDWGERTWATILDVWLRLIRKDGWTDRDAVLNCISALRDSQSGFEKDYLEARGPDQAKATALELIGLYHLAKAAEILAYYITDGVVDGKYQIKQLLNTHFDRVMAACSSTQMLDLESIGRLLAASALQMADNSIWTVTRAVNSRVTKFVRTLVDRGRGDKAIFDVLPPQRRTLAERGLLGSSRRAVVVSLPTSSGKTLIAEFRILQALNQFDHEKGWVAYLAPTRTLVNQITRQLRRDFEALDIIVEKVSPALEIDSVESDFLHQNDEKKSFRILVTTPEKLDLLLRQGLEEEIKRPLTLVIVDEAHNIQSNNRGLKLELLLATINSECQRAQFLLLTPFIDNAREVARWLGGQNSEDVSLALEWQPNDRVIGIVQAKKGELIRRQSYDYYLQMETIHTTRSTLATDEFLSLPKNEKIAPTFSTVSNPGNLAAVTAQKLSERGAVIVMHTTPRLVWGLAAKLKIEENKKNQTDKIKLVEDFLKLEFGSDFPLIELIQYGIGVHHSALSDEVRVLMEWLFEEGELNFLVATTTIAQGVNFPVKGVVMASHQYPYGEDMPPEDFWNIAGRAGRISQEGLGIIALVASDSSRVEILRNFINKQSGELNSARNRLACSPNQFLNERFDRRNLSV